MILFTQAQQTISKAALALGIGAGVFRGVLVAVFAVGLGVFLNGCSGGPGAPNAYPAFKIDTPGDRLQMVRVNAAADATKVVKIQAIRDGAFQDLVKHPMREFWNGVAARGIDNSKPRVSVVVENTKPNPAAAFSYRHSEAEQPFKQRQSGASHGL